MVNLHFKWLANAYEIMQICLFLRSIIILLFLYSPFVKKISKNWF